MRVRKLARRQLLIRNVLALLLLVVAPTGCFAGNSESEPPAAGNEPIICPEPRPQICTYDYNPVCATRDTGMRCVTTPCPSTEDVTYSNGCTACSDQSVISYRPGRCEPEDLQ